MFCTLALLLLTAGEHSSPQEVIKEALADLQAGNDNSARLLLARLLETEPASAPAHNLLGLVLMREREYARAEEEFRASIRLDPESAASYTNLGNALVQLHRDAEAEKEYRRALAIRPEDEAALENLGLLEARAQHFHEAANNLRRAHRLKPESLAVSAGLAASLISDKKLSEAEALIGQLPTTGEAAGNARHTLAMLALESGEPELGSRFVVGNPDGVRDFQTAALERAGSLCQAKRYEDARRMLAAVGNLEPQRADLHDLLGTVYYELDEPKQAIEELQTAIRMDPRGVDHYYKLGMIFLKHRTPDGALYVFENALKVVPQDHKLWLGLGLSNYIKGDLVTAKTDLYRALSLEPGDGPTYTVLCDLLVQSHADEELLRVIDSAIGAQPDNYLLPYYYGRVLAAQDEKRAIAELQRSITLNDHFARSHYELGKVLAQIGQDAAAIKALRKSIDLNPNLLEAHYQLGESYRRKGRQDLAEVQFAAVRQIRKDGSADELVQQLIFTIDK